MFSARHRIPTGRAYGKADLQQLCRDLHEAGFDSITIKLPHNLVGMEDSEILWQEFLERERNYPSVILCATCDERHETVKVLFVNISSKAYFLDDTFPSGHSESPELFVQSPDPARVHGLAGFFSAYFDKAGRRSPSILSWLAFALAPVILAVEVLTFAKTGDGFFSSTYRYGWLVDVALVIVAIVAMFYAHQTPRGLYVKERPSRSLQTLANMAIKGEAMDNPLVALIVGVLSTILAAIVMKLFGIL